VSTDPGFTRHGVELVEVVFSTVWAVPPGQPSGVIAQEPGNFVNPSSKQRIMVVPVTFANDTGPGTQVNINWQDTQGVGGILGGAVSVSISPCPGDFRPPQRDISNDRYLSFQCRGGCCLSWRANVSH